MYLSLSFMWLLALVYSDFVWFLVGIFPNQFVRDERCDTIHNSTQTHTHTLSIYSLSVIYKTVLQFIALLCCDIQNHTQQHMPPDSFFGILLLCFLRVERTKTTTSDDDGNNGTSSSRSDGDEHTLSREKRRKERKT